MIPDREKRTELIEQLQERQLAKAIGVCASGKRICGSSRTLQDDGGGSGTASVVQTTMRSSFDAVVSRLRWVSPADGLF